MLVICVARLIATAGRLPGLDGDVLPETGSSTLPVCCVSVSAARSSSIGETRVNRAGNATASGSLPGR